MSPSAVPLCPVCHSPSGSWQIDSPVRALDRVVIDPSGLRLLGLQTPDEGLEVADRPIISCSACEVVTSDVTVRDAVLAAATAAARGESPRFDA